MALQTQLHHLREVSARHAQLRKKNISEFSLVYAEFARGIAPPQGRKDQPPKDLQFQKPYYHKYMYNQPESQDQTKSLAQSPQREQISKSFALENYNSRVKSSRVQRAGEGEGVSPIKQLDQRRQPAREEFREEPSVEHSLSLKMKPDLEVNQVRTRMEKGYKCVKYAEGGLKPYEKLIYLEKGRLIWSALDSNSKDKFVQVGEVTKVEKSRNSPGFKKYDGSKADPELVAKSLVIRTKSQRVVELEFGSKAERDEFAAYLSALLREAKSN